jgi:hypothetical protein
MMDGFFEMGLGWIIWLLIIVVIVKSIFLDIRKIILQVKTDFLL